MARAREHLAVVESLDVPRAPTAEEREGWRRHWLAMAHGTSLGSDAGRHKFFRDLTGGRGAWSRAWFAACTDAEAAELLDHTRAITDDEKARKRAALEADATNAADELDEDE